MSDIWFGTPRRRRPPSDDMLILPRPRVLISLAFLTLLGTFYLSLVDFLTGKLSLVNIPFFTPKKPQVLLVSAFFPLAKSKHTYEEYAQWMTLYLSKVTTHIYFFTPPQMEATIRKLRGDLPMTLNTTFTTPFDVPPLKGLEGRYANMNKVDPENAYHSPELYAVWSSKTYFLREAMLNMQLAGTKIDYAFWNDAGSFRDKQDFANWPAPETVDEVFTKGAKLSSMHKDDLFFMPIWDVPKDYLRNWTPLEGPKESEGGFSEGSFFGGRPNSIHWWYKTYWAYHDYYIFKLNKFAGKDVVVYDGLFMLFPKHIIAVWQYDWQYHAYRNSSEGPLGECGGQWWYYQFFLASASEREHMREIWTPSYRTSPKFPNRPPGVDDGGESKVCRMSRVIWMNDVMYRKWGGDWQPPHTPVDTDVSYRD